MIVQSKKAAINQKIWWYHKVVSDALEVRGNLITASGKAPDGIVYCYTSLLCAPRG